MPSPPADRFERKWFERPTLAVARGLLGSLLVHDSPAGRTAGRVVETEAYCGPHDRAAHSSGGRRTERNRAMFGEKGHAYIYFVYGMHWCFNVVCGPPGLPQAVLIRALEPVEGLDLMRARLGGKPGVAENSLCRGPAKLCKALGLDSAVYGLDLTGDRLFVVPGRLSSGERVVRAARIGVDYAGSHALRPWRFLVADNPCISRRPSAAQDPA